MNLSGPIDIMAEVVSLFKDENMIAFFQFETSREAGAKVSGLCKIAKSRPEGMEYYSIDFIADAAGVEARRRFDDVLLPLSTPDAKALLTGIETLTFAPGTAAGTNLYVRHVDAILKKNKATKDKAFVDDMCTALRTACRMECEDPVWWEEIKDVAGDMAKPSFVAKLKKALKI